MTKVVIIGAGGVGGVVTHGAQLPEVFSEIVLASRTVQVRCHRGSVRSPDQNRAGGCRDNVPELAAFLKAEKPFMVINVALPYQDLTIMDACLEAGVHYAGHRQLRAAGHG